MLAECESSILFPVVVLLCCSSYSLALLAVAFVSSHNWRWLLHFEPRLIDLWLWSRFCLLRCCFGVDRPATALLHRYYHCHHFADTVVGLGVGFYCSQFLASLFRGQIGLGLVVVAHLCMIVGYGALQDRQQEKN